MAVAVSVEEVHAQDVVQAALEIERGGGEGLAVMGEDVLGEEVTVDDGCAAVHLGVEIVVELRESLSHPRLSDGDDRADHSRHNAAGEPDPGRCHRLPAGRRS